MSTKHRGLFVGVALLAALGLYVGLRFEVTTDLYAFLPEADDRALGTLSRQIAESELSRTMVLTVTGPSTDEVVRASRALERGLRRDPVVARELAFLEGGPPEGLERSLYELYAPRRLAFLAPSADEARAALTDEGLARAATTLTDELAGPMSPLIGRVAPEDPLLVLPGLFRALERSAANDLAVRDGRFVTRDGRSAVLLLGTKHSAFDADVQAPFLDAISRVTARVQANGRITVEQSGLNRFATRAATAIKGDIERVGSLSLVLIALLLLGVFRSLRLVALASIPVGAGVLAGSAAVLFLFGRVHGITVAFGASLIGVSVDYVVHVYCHRAVAHPADEGEGSFGAIGRTLLTGAATTITGFLSLAPSTLSGLREVACFAVTGMVAAFLATRYMVPPLMPQAFREVPLRARIVAGLLSVIDALAAHRSRLVLFPLLALAFIGVVLPRARWNEDMASLGRLDPAIAAEDARVRGRVAHVEMMRFVVTTGLTEDEALFASERVHRALLEAETAGELAGHRSISLLLPSARTQRAVRAVSHDDATLPARFERVFTEAGFEASAFGPFLSALRAPAPAPLDHAMLMRSKLAPLVRPFRLELGEHTGFVTLLLGVRDADALERRLEGVANAVFLRQADLFSSANRLYQRRTLTQLALGMLAVFAVLFARYRSARSTLAVLAPSLLSVGVTVSVLTLTGRGIDLVILTALLFVVSMGDDYGVFLLDAVDAQDREGLGAALLGVLIACATTLVGFGLLAFSEHPVLSGLGITAASGITASMILSPCTLLLLKRAPAKETA